MPHRKRALPEVAFNLLLTNAQAQETFKEIRKQWEAELIELQEQKPVGDTRYLEKVIAEFNPNNYQFKEHPQGILIEFVASEEMRKKAEPELERSQRQMLLMTFPHRCREYLDKGERLNADQLEDFWNQLVQFPDLFESDASQFSVTRIEDVVCGGIAVLLCLHLKWLEAHGERSAWCDEWLVRIITNPPTSDPMLFEGTLFDRSWDSFLANIAASAWRANPDDSEARTLVAAIAMTFRYETVTILMRSAVQQRNELGTEFERLLSLLLLWAGIRNIWNYSRGFNLAWEGVDRWRNRLMAAFVERRIPTQIASWARIAAASNRRVAWMQYRRTEGMEPTDRPGRKELIARMARKPGLDLGLLKSSFAAIPSLLEATSDQERSSWIRLWKEALGVTLRFASAGEEDKWGGDHHPSDYDSWLFERIAELIIHLRPEEDPPSFWSPILNLGPEGHRWVENFLRSWFTFGYGATTSVAHFASTWKSMIEHAMTSSAWKDANDWKGNRNLNSMWCHLFDNVWGSRLVKSEEFRGVIADMVPLYRDWAMHWLDRSDNIDTFAGFLCHPSAADLLPEGMKWIGEIVRQYSDHDWSQRPNNASAFIRLIEHWWDSHHGSSIPTAEVETAMGLLKLLSDRQIPRAMELQDWIAKPH